MTDKPIFCTGTILPADHDFGYNKGPAEWPVPHTVVVTTHGEVIEYPVCAHGVPLARK